MLKGECKYCYSNKWKKRGVIQTKQTLQEKNYLK